MARKNRGRDKRAAERPTANSPLLYAGVALAAALIGFGAVYVTARSADNADRGLTSLVAPAPAKAAESPAAPLPSGPGANPLSTGQMAAFVFKKTPEEVPEINFVDAANASKTLKDWQGRVVLLNLWATWCAPCRKEMPALDRLQKELGSGKFEVVALSVDRGGIPASQKFLDQIKVENLKLYVDSSARSSSSLKAVGLPTTLLIKDGREVGRLIGPAEWDSPEAKRLIEAALR